MSTFGAPAIVSAPFDGGLSHLLPREANGDQLPLSALAPASLLPVAAADLVAERPLSAVMLARQTATEAFAHPGRAVVSVCVVTAIAILVSYSPISLLVAGVSVAALLDLIAYRRSKRTHP